MLLTPVNEGDVPRQITLRNQNFWIQIFGILFDYMKQEMGLVIAMSLEEVVTVDRNRNGDCLGDFMRVRVLINVYQPLRRVLKVRLPNGKRFKVELFYENLPAYCFLCGSCREGLPPLFQQIN